MAQVKSSELKKWWSNPHQQPAGNLIWRGAKCPSENLGWCQPQGDCHKCNELSSLFIAGKTESADLNYAQGASRLWFTLGEASTGNGPGVRHSGAPEGAHSDSHTKKTLHVDRSDSSLFWSRVLFLSVRVKWPKTSRPRIVVGILLRRDGYSWNNDETCGTPVCLFVCPPLRAPPSEGAKRPLQTLDKRPSAVSMQQ